MPCGAVYKIVTIIFFKARFNLFLFALLQLDCGGCWKRRTIVVLLSRIKTFGLLRVTPTDFGTARESSDKRVKLSEFCAHNRILAKPSDFRIPSHFWVQNIIYPSLNLFIFLNFNEAFVFIFINLIHVCWYAIILFFKCGFQSIILRDFLKYCLNGCHIYKYILWFSMTRLLNSKNKFEVNVVSCSF